MITVTRRSRFGRLGLLATASAVMTSAMTFGVAWAVIPSPAPEGLAVPSSPAPADIAAGFQSVPAAGASARELPAPPADAVITLASYRVDLPPIPAGSRAPWWNSGTAPRVRAISQFDRGKLQSVNCTMAAGAMLASLAFGIVTTGSQLRSLQGDQSGGTGFGELNDAMRAGWRVQFARGWLAPIQLRALLWSGAGAAIHVDYGLIRPGYSLEERFKGGHSIYLDAFRPDGPSGPEYYVMDPIGPTWQGYRGDWWPADMVERAALSFGRGRIVTAWAYAGGTRLVGTLRRLPAAAYPLPSGKPRPGESLKPVDPPAPQSAPPTQGSSQGDSVPSDTGPTPTVPQGTPNPNFTRVGDVSIHALLSVCVAATRTPAFCPIGLPGDYPIVGPRISPPVLVAPFKLDLIYADSPQPGVERTIFTGPPGLDPTLSYWPTANGSAGPVSQAVVEAATLNGQQVWIATFPVAVGAYQFVASGSAGWGAGISQVGSVAVGGQ